MYDALSIINKGLGKIGASRIATIDPPRLPLERHCAEGYEHWVRSEIEKREWRFALAYRELTQSGPLSTVPADGRQFRYPLPDDCIAPIIDKTSEWEQRGTDLYSRNGALALAYKARKPEGTFPPSFVEVLACRVAVECVEFATQSNTKGQDADNKYMLALREAARSNAVVLKPRDLTTNDEDDTWVTARMQGI